MDKSNFWSKAFNFIKKTTPFVVTEEVYRNMFNHHIYQYKPLSFSDEDFPDLVKEKHTFRSGKNLLVGYIYKNKNVNPDKLLIFSHGYGGGGEHTYLDLIHCFSTFGFYVFAYDATANDESEGNKMRGFTQGYIDADNAMKYVESLKIYKDFPLYAAGHSWGAFSSSTAISNHPRIKGLIAFSGFNKATGIFKANGNKYAGEQADVFMPYVDTYEEFLFGRDADVTAINSFKQSKAKIVIIHSEDDKTVPISAGYDLYFDEFKKDPRFMFMKLTNKGHGTVYYTDYGKQYYDSFQSFLKQEVKKQKMNSEQKEIFIKTNLNRSIYNNMVDYKLIEKAIDFIVE